MSVGLLVCSFDLYNVRDLDLLRQVEQRCDTVVAGVLSDDDVEARTGWPPVIPLAERLEIMQAVRGVDRAIVIDADTLPGLDHDTIVFGLAFAEGVHEVLVPALETASATLREALGGSVEGHAAA